TMGNLHIYRLFQRNASNTLFQILSNFTFIYADSFILATFFSVIGAGIPSLYLVGSLAFLISAYVRLRRQKGLNYERLLNNRSNSNYGSIEQDAAMSDDDSTTGDADNVSDETLVSDLCNRNSVFDYTRLFISLVILGLFCFLVSIRWKDYSKEKHEYYWVITPVIEVAIWMYAIFLSIVNVKSKQRSVLHIRGHLDILYFLTFTFFLINIHSFYLKFGTEITVEYAFTLCITSFSFMLICISILEPPDDPEEICSKPNSEGRYLSPEVKSSLYDKYTFSWVNPLIKKGFRETLYENDVFELPYLCRAKNVVKSFREFRRSFVVSLFLTFRRDLVRQFFYAMVWTLIVAFAPPYFLKKILLYVQTYPNNEVSLMTAYMYVVALFLGTLIPSLCFQQALYIGRQISIKTQAIIIGEVYRKSLSRKDTSGVTDDEETKNKTGKITNLMSVDLQKVSEISAYVFYGYCYPLQIIITISYLYSLLGVSALTGVVAIILTYPLPALLNQRFQTIQKRLMAATDNRMGVMNELLQAIRIIKFFAWEKQFRDKVISARENELKEIKSRLMQWIYIGNVWMILPLIVMLAVFMTYTKILGNDLTAPVAFTALALFNILRHALDEIPATLVAFIQAKVSITRILNFLGEPEVVRQNDQDSNIDDPYIGFKDASFQWPIGGESSDDLSDVTAVNSLNRFTLLNLNVSFPVGRLSIICGPTGCGKTSLLMALLGEMECICGRAFLPRNTTDSSRVLGGAPSGVAYVAQTAWLQNATIRDNILFGLHYDDERYNKVLQICALNKDLEILEFGDKTEIGEKGITLSGGQKQRIALARAVYSQAKVIIIDDCLSAVDSHTAKHIYEQCLMGGLMKNRTQILVTHHVGLCIRGAAKVVVMKDGQIIGEGSSDKILNTGLLGEVALNDDGDKEDIIENVIDNKGADLQKRNQCAHEGDGKLIKEETKAEGTVEWKIYKLYFKASGGFLFWLFLILMFILTQFLQVSQDWWIREWTKAYDTISDLIRGFILSISSTISSLDVTSFVSDSYLTEKTLSLPQLALSSINSPSGHKPLSSNMSAFDQSVNVDYYIGIYVLIGLFTTVIATIRSYCMFIGSLAASRKLHNAILDRVLFAKIRFFDTTPIGRIMNRFSKDMETIDQNLSPVAMFLLYSCVATMSVIFVISCVMPQFLIAGLFIAAVYVLIGTYYLSTSRDLKRMESVSRSPIYALFGETITGVATIRAFGAETRLMKRILTLADANNRPYIFNWACNRWLNTRVDVAGGLVSLTTGVIVLYSLSNGMDSGLAGLALIYALNFTGHIIWVLRMYAVQEMNMNSVERVQEYLTLEEEPPRIINNSRPPANWPSRGDILVDNLVMQYAPENPPVLKEISFHVRPSEKVGIVGRTGSGKSTLAVSFFRFMEPTSGRIFIDGIDISTLGLFDLRSRLTIIPQDPVLFSGTLRSNLDSFGEYEDFELWNALRRAHLIGEDTLVQENGTNKDSNSPTSNEQSQNQITLTLDSPVSENGNNFSQGQRQLIALARALVRRSKLIIMDEATASVDFKTDRMIQETIRQEFDDATLLCIAHRLRTVVDYDRIIVLD
ncbi:10170_t:CDS:10, partial [Acaulospora morrowiae]